ncbi:MAG: thioredoxin family protein [Armatimonadota bacterium]|jgi:thioredoxin 1
MGERAYRIAVLVVVVVIIMAGVGWKLRLRSRSAGRPNQGVAQQDASGKGLPAMLDFAMGTCKTCKAMKPVLEDLAREYRGRARIEIIDMGESLDLADRYGVLITPTQVFLDADGEEVHRNEGFMSREDIVAQLAEMGVE